MIVLELFAGTRSIGTVFEARGHKVISIDWDKKFNDCIHADIYSLTVDNVINLCGEIPDMIWASPCCQTYSIASGGFHRKQSDGYLPKTEYAKFCDKGNTYLFTDLIPQLIISGTKYVFIENPTGAFRSMPFIKNYHRYTITYNQYGSEFQKRTDIFSNLDTLFFKPCKYGEFEKLVKSGDSVNTSQIPKGLCEYIADIVEEKAPVQTKFNL